MNSVLPLLCYQQSLKQPDSCQCSESTIITSELQALPPTSQLCMYLLCNCLPVLQSLLFLGENLLNITLGYSLICNMPRLVDLRDHHPAVQQGRGLYLVPKRGWCFIFNGAHFHIRLFGAGILFVQLTLSEMLDAGTIRSCRSLLCHDVWYCFLTCLNVTGIISRIC